MPRTEQDFLGKKEIPAAALYGIQSIRACDNFPDKTPFHKEWYKSIALVKLAYYQTYQKFARAIQEKFAADTPLKLIPENIVLQLIESATELAAGKHFEYFIVPAMQGGAGTSINLNINEIIANRALQLFGDKPGNYYVIDPFEHANIYQSTNDVIPSALRICAIQLLTGLEESINRLRFEIEKLEKNNRHAMRLGYTQMQAALPSSFGILFSTYNEALSRDWWRVSKCFERIKMTNLGGGATGTGLAVPRFFIMEIVNRIQKLTNLPITRSENLPDATANQDTLVEVHAILKAHAVNLEKMVSDLRLLSAQLTGNPDLKIPPRQVGSSIMPGKVNPVITEYVISVVHKVYSNDSLISRLAAQGNLELNAYTPVIGHALIESIKLLTGANDTLKDNLINGIKINSRSAYEKLMKSPAITTALLPYTGYKQATKLAAYMKNYDSDIFAANKKLKIIDEEKLNTVLHHQNLLKEGFSVFDLIKKEKP